MIKVNFKQLEAFVSVNEMQSFQAAARKLQLSQAAVSKHIHEFEKEFIKPLFDRSGRSAKLTLTGHEVLEQARDILQQRNGILRCLTELDASGGTLRVGLTELAALTWLPAFMREVSRQLPDLSLEIGIDHGIPLMQRLDATEVDLVFLPNVLKHAHALVTPMASMRNGWFCSVESDIPHASLRAVDLSDQTLLVQTQQSTAGIVVGGWLARNSVFPKKIFSCDSLPALAGMAVSGLGVAMLPQAVSGPLMEAGLLREVEVRPKLKSIQYCAMTRAEPRSAVLRKVVDIARSVCDFNLPYQSTIRHADTSRHG